MREPGYYWILYFGEWLPAEWLPGQAWNIIGDAGAVREDEVTTVGTKLDPPTDI